MSPMGDSDIVYESYVLLRLSGGSDLIYESVWTYKASLNS